jgi:hypothetical protein
MKNKWKICAFLSKHILRIYDKEVSRRMSGSERENGI